jgi:hypothetical protein
LNCETHTILDICLRVKKTLKIYKEFKPLHVEIFVLQASEFQPFWCPSSFEQKRFPSSLPQTLVNFPIHPHPPKKLYCKIGKKIPNISKISKFTLQKTTPKLFCQKKGKKKYCM